MTVLCTERGIDLNTLYLLGQSGSWRKTPIGSFVMIKTKLPYGICRRKTPIGSFVKTKTKLRTVRHLVKISALCGLRPHPNFKGACDR